MKYDTRLCFSQNISYFYSMMSVEFPRSFLILVRAVSDGAEWAKLEWLEEIPQTPYYKI